jgi:Kef-type K+ transport system membrane component KefB/nucleotide-binding universal stress UspA family protein
MEPTFSSIPHHDLLTLLIQLAVLLFVARLMGELAVRLDQPSVIGEIVAGIVIGPSLLSGLFPALGSWLVPHTPTQSYLLETFSLVGVLLLMLLTGIETDISLMRRQMRSALGVSLGGLLLPFISGLALGLLLPESMLVREDQRTVFALFLAIAMSISAIPVIAKVLMELNLLRRGIGQTIIAAAMVDDTIGWILLSVVSGLASGAAISAVALVEAFLVVIGFLLVSLTVGLWLVRRVLYAVQSRFTIQYHTTTVIVFLMFLWGAVSLLLGLEALLGAFFMGILLAQIPSLNNDVVHALEHVTLSIFAPVFFAVAGLKVNIPALLRPDLLVLTFVVIGFATFGKILGVYTGARAIGGSDHWTALFYGSGLNARGSMGIVVAAIGLSLGVLTQEMFSMIVVMAVTTSLMAPLLLRWTVQHITPDPEELARLRQEEANRDNLAINLHRVLLPLRAGGQAVATRAVEVNILQRLEVHNRELDVTLLTVSPYEARQTAAQWLADLTRQHEGLRAASRKVIVGDNPGDAILNEASRDYDLMVIGVSEGRATTDVLFTPIVDYLVRLSSVPVLLVAGHNVQPDWRPRRILVPTNGSLAARRAAQFAFALAGEQDEVYVLRVVERNVSAQYLESGTLLIRQMAVARQSVDDLIKHAEAFGAAASGDIQIGTEPEKVILEYAAQHRADLIVVGTSVTAQGERLYMGPRVERILRDALCPVLVLNNC